jgi:hypothetical protein
MHKKRDRDKSHKRINIILWRLTQPVTLQKSEFVGKNKCTVFESIYNDDTTAQ